MLQCRLLHRLRPETLRAVFANPEDQISAIELRPFDRDPTFEPDTIGKISHRCRVGMWTVDMELRKLQA